MTRHNPFPTFLNMMDPCECPFLHEDIDVLYGVEPRPIEELPTTCTCGAPLTYAAEVAFVEFAEGQELEGVVTDTREMYSEGSHGCGAVARPRVDNTALNLLLKQMADQGQRQ